MSTDIYWRIGMEGDHASLRTPRRYNRGHAGGHGPGNIARRSAAVNSTGTATSTTWRRW